MKRKTLIWESTGIIFIFVLGSVLHYAYDWSGQSVLLAPFVPVNESLWEHFKLGVWPGFIFALPEYRLLRPDGNNFWVAKAASLWAIPFLTAIPYYSLTAITGERALIMDILIFAFAVIAAQTISYRIITGTSQSERNEHIAYCALVLLFVLFMLFTGITPRLPVFMDPLTGAYGPAA